MKTIRELPGWFSQLKISGKLAVAGAGLLLLFFMCSVLSAIYLQSAQPPLITPTYKGADSVVLVTWTPAGSLTPTSSVTLTSTPLPTRTPLPTSLPTRSFETATTVILPTGTIRPVIISGSLNIVYVDKTEEYVDIQNFGTPVDLSGWLLVSERGNQICRLNGILQTNEVLRIWAGTEETGYSCGFLRTIWTDTELDPAVLYNPDGREVSRYPPR